MLLYRFRCRGADAGAAHPRQQTGRRVVFDVPVVHHREFGFGVRDRDLGAFGDHIEIGIGDDARHFENDVVFRIESGHLEIHPNQITDHGTARTTKTQE